MDYLPGSGWKKVNVYISDGSHADLRIKLRYYNISQKEFLRTVIESIIEENPLIIKLIMEKLDSRKSKRVKKNIKKDQIEKEKIINNFALNEEEIEDIFDLLERENGEL